MSAASDTGEDAPIVPAVEEEPAYSQQSTAPASEASDDMEAGPSYHGDMETGEHEIAVLAEDAKQDNAAYDPGADEAEAPIMIPMPNNNIEKAPIDDNGIEMTELNKEERRAKRERLFFVNDSSKRVDYVLVYEDTGDKDKQAKRQFFQENLDNSGLDLEIRDKTDSIDLKSNFVLLHATWDAIGTGAELLNMRKRIKMPKDLGESTYCSCCDPFSPSEEVVPSEDDYFTAPFHFDKLEMFDLNPHDEEERATFFTNAERSLIVKELLDRTGFSDSTSSEQRFGIGKLLREEVYSTAFPLHEGARSVPEDDPDPWTGKDMDRARLYEAWARPGRWYCYQPLDLIRKYFGEKIAIYFAWLGYYTTALIPAAVVGLVAFIYGLATLYEDKPSEDICDDKGAGATIMCPQCDERCDYYELKESCVYSKITYVFDNWATAAFAVFMGIWAVCFLEFWKRKQNVLRYEWDVAQFELEERMRPEFEFKVKNTKENPITKLREPYVAFPSRVARTATSFSVVLTMICVVIAAIFGVILYRMIIIVVFSRIENVDEYSSIFTSITAAVCNLIVIMLLNVLYGWIATRLTDMEMHRTESEYGNALIFKMFLFKFVNFYGSTFYIAYFKGSFVGHPGQRSNYLFGEYRPDGCDPAGCMVDLFLHLALVMVGKQALNNAKELLLPWILKWWRARSSQKSETSTNLYMRWEQDNDYGEMNKLGMFEEYLEMVIQYGFVTLFVAAFPLAPLFALLNNIIEIRLDAFKFVSIWKRPHAAKADGIGIWLDILQGISFIAVLTNAFIIGWTSEFVPKLVYILDGHDNLHGYMNNSLSMFDTGDFHSSQTPSNPEVNYTICHFKGWRESPGHVDALGKDDEYEYTREFYLIFTARLAIVIIFEHICFLVTSAISYAIPDTPAHVERLRLYEKQLVKKMTFDKSFAELKNKRHTMHRHNNH